MSASGDSLLGGQPVPQLLAGRRGVVLGVSSENSIGFQSALRLREMGAEVALTYRASRREAVLPLAQRLGCTLHAVADFDDETSVKAAFATIASAWDRIDFLVHSVMHVPPGVLATPLVEVSIDAFHRVLDTGAWSLVVACREALPLLARSDSPRVVTLTSPAAHRASPHYHVAGITKAALESTLLYLAQELGPQGILCNAVSSSLIATDGALRTGGESVATSTRAHIARRTPTGRATESTDVANCVAYLCSSLAANVTGEIISVDGGFSRRYL